MSLDGFIATKEDDLSFLSAVEQAGIDYGYSAFTSGTDTVIMGRRTYDKVMTLVDQFPHSDKETYIITRSARPPEGNITFYTGNLKDLITTLKSRPGKTIYCDGGAGLAAELLRQDLLDDLIISLIPVLLGDGIRLFPGGLPEQSLEFISSQTWPKGLVQLHYTRNRSRK